MRHELMALANAKLSVFWGLMADTVTLLCFIQLRVLHFRHHETGYSLTSFDVPSTD
jgi:hypothetical protein